MWGTRFKDKKNMAKLLKAVAGKHTVFGNKTSSPLQE
jgi:hypothetical protein